MGAGCEHVCACVRKCLCMSASVCVHTGTTKYVVAESIDGVLCKTDLIHMTHKKLVRSNSSYKQDVS